MSVRPQLLARLRLDLEELHGSPYPGVEVIANEQDLRQMCLLLSPPSGPWKGLRLHFDVELPTNWPTSSPRIRNSVHGVEHPNLFGGYICCDLLKEHFYAEKGYTGGYTPALTLRGLFLQFLTFFSNSTVDQDLGGTRYIGEAVEVSYHYESEMTDAKPPSTEASPDPRRDREKEWRADTSDEVVVAKFGSDVDEVTQTTKRGMQDRPASKKLIRVSFINPRFVKTALLLSRWQCLTCPYGTPALPHTADVFQPSQQPVQIPSPTLNPPSVCLLPKLNDDVLYLLTEHLPTESLLSFSLAYPRLHRVVNDSHLLLHRELRCFFLRTPLRNSILGIGIDHDGRQRTLQSDFDWLSMEAFNKFHVRKSISKRTFKFFLPLAFGGVHFTRARQFIWNALSTIDDHVIRTERLPRPPPDNPMHPLLAIGPRTKPTQLVRVLFKFMNNVVVSLMKSCDDVLASTKQPRGGNASLLQASEKAIIAYCQLFHLLICLCESDPEITASAYQSVKTFIADRISRHKQQLADMGEFIILCSLVLALQPITLSGQPEPEAVVEWKTHLSGPLLEEAHIRNARWVLREVPDLEYCEAGASEYRLAQTFHHTRTSLRLIMFQIAFLDLVVAVPPGQSIKLARRLDQSYGFTEKSHPSEKSVPEQMVERIKAIYVVKTWPEFFERVQFDEGKEWDQEAVTDMLRGCIRESGRRDYHSLASGKKLNSLKSQRPGAERQWQGQRSS